MPAKEPVVLVLGHCVLRPHVSSIKTPQTVARKWGMRRRRLALLCLGIECIITLIPQTFEVYLDWERDWEAAWKV